VRKIWSCGAGTPFENSLQDPIIGVSCHSVGEVGQAAGNAATFAVFGPVFEKIVSEKRVFEKKDASPPIRPTGISLLAEACRSQIPVLALGGITLNNARSCLDAGAAGIAAIRLFQENDIAEVILQLRH
jgi:thiamine-phosphate pyrophosphorylase